MQRLLFVPVSIQLQDVLVIGAVGVKFSPREVMRCLHSALLLACYQHADSSYLQQTRCAVFPDSSPMSSCEFLTSPSLSSNPRPPLPQFFLLGPAVLPILLLSLTTPLYLVPP